MLPQGSPEPGPWRSDRSPYTIAIGEAAVSGLYKHVFGCMAAQMGKTQGFFSVIGQRLDDNPVPILFIGPTKSNVTGVIEPKVHDMLQSCASLWTKTSKGKKYSIFKKVVSGVVLRFAWAGSTTEIKSDTACIVIVDEIDETDPDLNGQGDIVSLADARHSAYPDGITLGASTPTIGSVNTYIHPDTGMEHWEVSDDVESLIWRYWQGGTRHEWAWPCPDCGEYFIPRLKLLWWPSKATPEQAEREARLICPKCGTHIETRHKSDMNARGRYVAPGQWVDPDGTVHGDPPESSDATFWVSGLANFSSKKTFGFLAHAFLRAARSGDPESVKGVLNAEFGECFKVRGEAPEWESVRDLGKRSNYILGQVPSSVVSVVAGIDVQKNRLVYVVRGFGDAYGSALIERGEYWGETDQPEVWAQLEVLLMKEWDGRPMSKMAVDSGYRPEPVYEFARRHRGLVLPTKGHDHLDKPYYAKLIDCNVRGRLIKNGVQLWHFDSDSFKSWVHSRVDWPEDQPGGWLVPSDIDEDYCKQIVSEQRIQKPSGGSMWIKTSVDNHYLDCEALAYLAIRINGIVKKLPAAAVEHKARQQQPPPGRDRPQGRFDRRSI